MAKKSTTRCGLVTVGEVLKLAGGATKLARRITELTPDDPITQSAVTQWQYRPDGLVPMRRAPAVAAITRISLGDLRPDLREMTIPEVNPIEDAA
jgi:DNA-binding transcriptional regulator YdaS (Cro superfamily)